MAITALKDVNFTSGVPVALYDSSYSGYRIDLGPNDRIYRNGTQMIVPCQYVCCGVMFWGTAAYACSVGYACCAGTATYADCAYRASSLSIGGCARFVCAASLSYIQSCSCAQVLYYT